LLRRVRRTATHLIFPKPYDLPETKAGQFRAQPSTHGDRREMR
jgi:hypothetical protein